MQVRGKGRGPGIGHVSQGRKGEGIFLFYKMAVLLSREV